MTIHGIFLPKKYFVVKGITSMAASDRSALDQSMVRAGLGMCNVIRLNHGMLPGDAEYIDPVALSPGTLVFGYFANASGEGGTALAAGVGWANCRGEGSSYSLVTGMAGARTPEEIDQLVKIELKNMVEMRQMEVVSFDTSTVSIKVVEGHWGCALVGLIFMPWDVQVSKRSAQSHMGGASFV